MQYDSMDKSDYVWREMTVPRIFDVLWGMLGEKDINTNDVKLEYYKDGTLAEYYNIHTGLVYFVVKTEPNKRTITHNVAFLKEIT
jgi:hypothetical protein